ncbi:hypothetical protein L1987_44508 [Smallanthus sonchifolius]|uniref:Uncharacterized protein n=1 Tax=Smallanthus sonchifolius TaxID=185202 RepID=A0ACB9GQY0_9ASTR|nr:hypothetical protein L1987_44508 [Smallanthus sonchifolius]
MDFVSCDNVVLWNLYDIIGANQGNHCNLVIQCNLHGSGPISLRSYEEWTWCTLVLFHVLGLCLGGFLMGLTYARLVGVTI